MPGRGAVLLAATLAVAGLQVSAAAEGPMAVTRSVLERSNTIVRGSGDRKQKLAALSDLLNNFLDTEALAKLAAGSHLEGRSQAETAEFYRLFHDFFVRTHVGTTVITPGDRFAVDYTLRRVGDGWRATDIVVEGVSLARNFRAQFDAAVAKDSFQGLLDRLRAKVAAGDGS